MLIQDKTIQLKITSRNIKYYENRLGVKLEKNSFITLKQEAVQKTSRTLVECKCDFCEKSFEKQMSDVRNATFCDKNCRNEYLKTHNPNPTKEKINVNCEVCNSRILVNEAKSKLQKYFLCSRDCYKKHRSMKYNKEKMYNYQDTMTECEVCKKSFKRTKWHLEKRNNLFCSQECYWRHRKQNYKEFYYKSDLNEKRPETTPEKLVREWLENNNIYFKQEFGFLKKYYIDFYLPEYKVFIEVFGDYWHVNPKIYGECGGLKPLTNQQVGKQEEDRLRIAEIESYGYKVYIIWEQEIHSNLNLYMGKILDNINKNPQRLHAKPL